MKILIQQQNCFIKHWWLVSERKHVAAGSVVHRYQGRSKAIENQTFVGEEHCLRNQLSCIFLTIHPIVP